MKKRNLKRAEHEIIHGKVLSMNDTEHLWGWGTLAGQLRAKRRADMIIAGAGLAPGMRVLEIGCGTGMFTDMFAKTGTQIIAVDISPDLIKKAKKRGLPEEQVIFLEKRFEDCQIDGPFDAIIGSSVLHHLEIEEALTKLYKLIKPGGYLCFAEPNMLNPQVFMERKFRFLPCFSYVSADETAFVRWKLKKLILSAGFINIEIIPFDWLHPATPKLLIPIVKKVGGLIEKTPVLREFSGSLFIRLQRPY